MVPSLADRLDEVMLDGYNYISNDFLENWGIDKYQLAKGAYALGAISGVTFMGLSFSERNFLMGLFGGVISTASGIKTTYIKREDGDSELLEFLNKPFYKTKEILSVVVGNSLFTNSIFAIYQGLEDKKDFDERSLLNLGLFGLSLYLYHSGNYLFKSHLIDKLKED